MIRMSCKSLVEILSEIRRALGITRDSRHKIDITASRSEVTVRAETKSAAIACQTAATGRNIDITLPIGAFASVPNLAKQEVTIAPTEDGGTIEWRNSAGVRSSITEKSASAPLDDNDHNSSISAERSTIGEPDWLISNQRELGKALSQAASIADPTSLRYSLGCLRLRGCDGQVAATDGRQAYVASGFAFPLDEVLVPSDVLSRLSGLSKCESISVGRTDDFLALRYGVGQFRWMVDLKIMKAGRFPNIDQCFPLESASRCEIQIDDHDAGFLLENLDRLVGKSAEIVPLTIDLSRNLVLGRPEVHLRFRRHDATMELSDAPVIEVHLERSSFQPGPMRTAIDHHFLLNAMRLGFRRFHLQQNGFPIFCIHRQSRYTCAPLHESLTIGATPRMQSFSSVTSYAAA